VAVSECDKWKNLGACRVESIKACMHEDVKAHALTCDELAHGVCC
jgi:hypothetical protein